MASVWAIRVVRAGIAVTVAAVTACQSALTAPVDDAEHGVPRLLEIFVGEYSSARQAERDPDYVDLRLSVAEIWPERTDGPWLYVEQSAAETPDRPYRQRVLRLLPGRGADSVEARVYELPGDPLLLAGAAADVARFALLDRSELVPRDGCSISLREDENGEFSGSTLDRTCPNSFRGASYATSDLTVAPDEVLLWDRGFDAAGSQVWGAERGPYIFLRD